MVLNEIKNITVKEMESCDKYYEVCYDYQDKKISKDAKKTLDIVKVLLYHKEKDAFVLVHQFRPLVYVNHPELSIRYELCGGRLDKELSLEDIAKEEVLEECGYNVESLQKVTSFIDTGIITLYYGEVNDSMKINSGGGLDYEPIEVVYLPIQKAKDFLLDENKPKRPSLAFMFMWWFDKFKR